MHERRRNPLTRARPAAALAAVALFILGLASAMPVQAEQSAVPEFIELTEAERLTPAGAELASAQEAFRSSLGEDPERALEIAKVIVALTTEIYGESHAHVSRALTNLAIVQAENANFGAAIENFISAIDARERAAGTIVSKDLINPLRGLASAFMALDEAERAIPVYERAIHISHVNEGPNNLEQVEIIDALARAHFFNGDLEAANDMQDAIFRLRERRADDNPDQFLDALEQRAAWYARLGEFDQSVVAYRRLERTISAEYGGDDPRLIQPLVSLANSVVQVIEGGDFAVTEGRRAIGRAVRVARANSDDNPALLARTLVAQGDWLMSLGWTRKSRLPYREAWDVLSSDPALYSVRNELFAAPVPVWRPPLRRALGRRGEESPTNPRFSERGYVDVAFDVDPLGRPMNVRVLDASPPGLMDRHVRRQIRRFKFRPAFSEGQPSIYSGIAYRHTYRYDESELTDKERRRMEETTYDAPETVVFEAADTLEFDGTDDTVDDGASGSDAAVAPLEDGLIEDTGAPERAPQSPTTEAADAEPIPDATSDDDAPTP